MVSRICDSTWNEQIRLTSYFKSTRSRKLPLNIVPVDIDLSGHRKSYEKRTLLESEVSENPMQQFRIWYHDAEESGGVEEANAVTLSTLGIDGYPKGRVVLLKRYTHEGFIFFTNYLSEKGRAITTDPRVCLSFFWPTLERQVIIKGIAEKIAENLSDGYFESRPEGSKLSAVVSEQSSVIASREELERKLKGLEQKYEGQEIPRPKHWGGFLVRPQEIEFWQGRPDRLHDRLRYQLQPNFDWKLERLAP